MPVPSHFHRKTFIIIIKIKNGRLLVINKCFSFLLFSNRNISLLILNQSFGRNLQALYSLYNSHVLAPISVEHWKLFLKWINKIYKVNRGPSKVQIDFNQPQAHDLHSNYFIFARGCASFLNKRCYYNYALLEIVKKEIIDSLGWR